LVAFIVVHLICVACLIARSISIVAYLISAWSSRSVVIIIIIIGIGIYMIVDVVIGMIMVMIADRVNTGTYVIVDVVCMSIVDYV
jgi:hypothetical protein